jgi:hypothetical protein
MVTGVKYVKEQIEVSTIKINFLVFAGARALFQQKQLSVEVIGRSPLYTVFCVKLQICGNFFG